jgi:hypothetical protein
VKNLDFCVKHERCKDIFCAWRNVNFHGMGNNEDVDGDLDFIKLKIPNFQGKSDPEAYLE